MNPESPTNTDCLESPWTRDGTYIIECTKKAQSCCRSCESTIDIERLRVGVVYQHKNGYVCINWHHLECYPHVRAIPLGSLEGYTELDATNQQLVRHHCQLAADDALRLRQSSTCSA